MIKKKLSEKMWLGRIIGNPVAPKPVYALNKKRMPKHPLSM
jgi:hypothetical protein